MVYERRTGSVDTQRGVEVIEAIRARERGDFATYGSIMLRASQSYSSFEQARDALGFSAAVLMYNARQRAKPDW